MQRYSAFSLFAKGLRGHREWKAAWDDVTPRARYDAVIIGGGGHGLATAYYLAKNHNLRNVAVIERGWIGGGNTGRNTAIIRSNYFYPESANFYDFSLKLYEKLTNELNYNIMFSPRGHWMLAHDRHGSEMLQRAANAMLLNGVDARLCSAAEVHKKIPYLNESPRFPVTSGLVQPRAGIARHDAVAWGYARAANHLGVDIIQDCNVVELDIQNQEIRGVVTTRGKIATERVGVAVAGQSSELAALAGFELPITSYGLQACVTEPIKPFLNTVITSSATGLYVSQSDKGEIVVGSALDLYGSYAQRGNLPVFEHSAAALKELFPTLSRLRFLRQWAGVVDVTPDSTPIVGPTPVRNLFINCGWGTGGFKAIPGSGYCFAHTIATGSPHPLIKAFSLERFISGSLINETAASGIEH